MADPRLTVSYQYGSRAIEFAVDLDSVSLDHELRFIVMVGVLFKGTITSTIVERRNDFSDYGIVGMQFPNASAAIGANAHCTRHIQEGRVSRRYLRTLDELEPRATEELALTLLTMKPVEKNGTLEAQDR